MIVFLVVSPWEVKRVYHGRPKTASELNPSRPRSPQLVVVLKDPHWNDHICNNSHKPIEILATPWCGAVFEQTIAATKITGWKSLKTIGRFLPGRGREKTSPPRNCTWFFFGTGRKKLSLEDRKWMEMMCWAKVDVWNIISTWHPSLRKQWTGNGNMKHVVKLVLNTFETTKPHRVLDPIKKVTVYHIKWQSVNCINSFTASTHRAKYFSFDCDNCEWWCVSYFLTYPSTPQPTPTSAEKILRYLRQQPLELTPQQANVFQS